MSVISLHDGRAPDPAREKAVRLYKFLRDYTLLRTGSVRTTDSYEEVIWLSQVPRLPGCRSAAFDAEGKDTEIWLQVAKPRIEPVPQPPEILRPWIKPDEIGDSTQDAPSVFESIPEADDSQEADEEARWVDFRDQTDVVEAYDTYLDREWRPWAWRDRLLAGQQSVYTELFRLYQSQQRLGEAYEVVLGLGDLAWRSSGRGTVRRHLVVAQTDVRFDSRTGLITVIAAADGARPVLEQDMLEPEERPQAGELDRISSILAEVGDDIFTDEGVSDAVETWVHAASPDGVYDSSLERQEQVSGRPVVHLAPALILRKRSDRAIVQALESIISHLSQEGAYVPDGVRQLVGIEEGRQTDVDESPSARPAGEEPLFPLPVNEEQLDIVRRLSGRSGVLVQGPPGTGKSHTIANLVAHMLAHGQRVLVTSHTARALEVLRDKIPEEIRQLAVVVLGNDVSGRDELRASVLGIQRRHSLWNARRSRELVVTQRTALGNARKQEAAVLGQLRAIRETDSYRHPPCFGGYEGTAQEIGAALRRRSAEYEWIDKGAVPDTECPLSRSEAMRLWELLNELDEKALEELALALPDLRMLPGAADFGQLVDRERSAAAESTAVARDRSHPAYAALRSCSPSARHAFWSAVNQISMSRSVMDRRAEPWIATAVNEVLVGYAGRWRELAGFTGRQLQAVQLRLQGVAHAQVTGLEDRDVATALGDSRVLLEHFQGGRGSGAWMFRPAAVKRARYIFDSVRFNGDPCRDAVTLGHLVGWLEVQDYLHGLDSEWAALIAAVPSGSPGARASAYTDLLRILEAVLQLQAGVAAAVSASAAVRGLVPPEWQDAGAVSDVVGAAAAADRDEVWTAAYAHLHAVEEIFRGVGRQPQAAHPAVDAMLDAVLGRDVDLYSRARASIEALAARRGAVEERDLLLGRLRTAAPVVSAAVEVEGPDRDRRLATLDNAWNWARADAWLHRLADPNELRRLERELDDCRRRVEDTTRTLAAELAWAQTMARLTESERQHLVAWETAVRRIGKGTGKMAPVWRARAREAMEGCRPAVPAWIMPIFKVAETVGIVPEAFDVVIIDEASQSGPEAFFLQFLARKVIVVGDDQQISPSNIGIVREKVQVLNAQYMKDIPLGSFFVTDNSLFDIAAIRYRDRIMLREHFRCMPEIIQFSNDLCYQDQPLIPLRQFGADRLSPTIQVRHIRDGYRNGDVNEPEAEAVVQQVVSCIDDPAYAGKTFGVISLVGPGQAEFIRRRLALVVDPEEIERRQILCGEAYAFQGDERDVIFLSLVLAPTEGRRMGSLTKDADKRRFNVAASRARDQMWLFHTATLNDLHPDSVAHRLLNYCLHPGVERTPLRDVGLADLRRRIDEHERGEAAPRPFDSWFEADVFLHLADRGYRVIPQYPMADYSVDLVVEGLHGRLAVECDGDVWHGAEAFDRDAYRQRMLERCGMHFVRIRGSAYYRDPSVALEPLWAELRSRGIRPEAEDAVMVSAADRTEPEGAEATSPELGDEPETVVEEDGELKEANEVDELSAEPGDSPVSPRPSSWTGPYVVAHPASRRVPVDIHLSGADAETRRIIQEVIGIEAPVAVDLIVRRVRDAWGIGRAGNRVTEAVERQIDLLRNRGFIQIRDGFVYRVDGGPVKVRVPTEDPVTIREVEHVSPEELCGSMVQIVKEAGGFSRPDLVRATARLFGWRRVGPDISRILDDRIAELLGAAQLIELSGQISWAEGRRPPIVERSDGTPRGREHVVANRVAEMDGAALSRPGPEALQKPPQSSAPTTFPNDLERSMTERGWRGRRSEVNRIEARLAQAHKEGDHARIASLAAKLSDLRAQLEDVLVLPRPVGNGQAVLGCWVEFRDNGGPSESWLLVPPMEDDAAAGHLNVNTPFGRALYGHAAGDRVEVATRDGHHSIEVLSIVVD